METLLPPRFYTEGSHIVDVTCTDVDLDGWNDLVLSATRDYQGSRLVIWRNMGDGTGAFEDVTNEWAPNDWPEDWMFRAYVDDFNGDGWPDVFTSGYPVDKQKVYLNTGGNGFVTQESPNLFEELHIIDANNDGKTDLFTSNPEVPTTLYISN